MTKAVENETRVTRRAVEAMPCKLTPDEFIARAQELAKCNEEIAAEESRGESLKQQLKSSLAAIEARRARLSSVVGHGEEVRNVQIEYTLDYTDGRALRVRMDTGEILEDRPMHDHERQRKANL